MIVLLWILFGALVGWIGSLLVTTSHPIRIIVIGMIGGTVSGWLADTTLGGPMDDFNIYSVIAASAGSALLIYMICWLYKKPPSGRLG